MDTITYQFEMNREAWREFADNLPRSIPLDERIRELIRKDTVTIDDDADLSEASVDVMASRIRIRAIQAQGAIREGDDEKADEQLAEITELTSQLEL
ncbi:MAG: hypothetical protein ACOCQM_05910 [Natronomonas sp.]